MQRLHGITHSRTEKRAVRIEWSEQGEEVIKSEVGEGRTLHTIEGGKMEFSQRVDQGVLGDCSNE